MKNNIKIRYLLSIGLIFLFTILLLWGILHFKSSFNQNKEIEGIAYPPLNENSREIKGLVIRRDISAYWAGKYLFDLSSNQKFYLSGLTINRKYEKDIRIY